MVILGFFFVFVPAYAGACGDGVEPPEPPEIRVYTA